MNLTKIKKKNREKIEKKFGHLLFTGSEHGFARMEELKSSLSQAEDRIIGSIRSMIDDLDDDGIIHTSEIKKVLKTESPGREKDLEKLKELRQSLESINENIEWLEDIKMDMEDEIGVLELWIDKDKKEL